MTERKPGGTERTVKVAPVLNPWLEPIAELMERTPYGEIIVTMVNGEVKQVTRKETFVRPQDVR